MRRLHNIRAEAALKTTSVQLYYAARFSQGAQRAENVVPDEFIPLGVRYDGDKSERQYLSGNAVCKLSLTAEIKFYKDVSAVCERFRPARGYKRRNIFRCEVFSPVEKAYGDVLVVYRPLQAAKSMGVFFFCISLFAGDIEVRCCHNVAHSVARGGVRHFKSFVYILGAVVKPGEYVHMYIGHSVSSALPNGLSPLPQPRRLSGPFLSRSAARRSAAWRSHGPL